MQRPLSSTRASLDDWHQHVIDIMQQSQSEAKYSPRKKMEGFVYQSLSSIRSKSAQKKWIHVVPVTVLLCIFILWWFSYPVNLEIKDGRIIAAHKIELPQSLNETHFDLTILALASPPNGSIPQILTLDNETEAQEVSSTD